jgi:hypothetical protein
MRLELPFIAVAAIAAAYAPAAEGLGEYSALIPNGAGLANCVCKICEMWSL